MTDTSKSSHQGPSQQTPEGAEDFLGELKAICDAEWAAIKTGTFFELVRTADVDLTRQLYIKAMVQVFHYTKNNAMNQAAATWATDHKQHGLVRFAIRHALEEIGHEYMVVNDLRSIGVDLAVLGEPPLPATAALNGYLDSVALRGGAIPRLGYSFWAEDSYEHLKPLLDVAMTKLGLNEKQLTFFISHAVIDEKHAADVNKAIAQFVVSDEQKAAVRLVARTTLFLTGQLLEGVARELKR